MGGVFFFCDGLGWGGWVSVSALWCGCFCWIVFMGSCVVGCLVGVLTV